MAKSVLIEASSENLNSTAILELIIYVTNYAPYFKEGPPENEVIQLNSTNNTHTFEIPEIVD